MSRRPYALLGQSRAIVDVLDELRHVSATDFRVLLTGESGVGKKQFAQFIHDSSPRRQRTMLSVNCAHVPESHLETTLFAQGDGLFEMAHDSTLLLDDVDGMGPQTQALLLRALDEDVLSSLRSDRGDKTVDVRIISTTECDLLERTAEKSFSDHLFYRLNLAHLQIPPLRERREDVSCVMDACLESVSEQFRLPLCKLHPCALAKLETHSWPGNIREVQDVAEYLALTYPGSVVTVDQLPPTIGPAPFGPSAADPVASACFDRITQNLESFWTVVYEPFLAHILSRATVRAVISRGLRQTNGSYRALTAVFNLPPEDHLRLLTFLHQYECVPRPQAFRAVLDDVRTASSREHKAAG